MLEQEVDDYYASFTITKELLELRNLTLVAKLMVDCAQRRKESRGLHFNSDYPHLLAKGENTVLIPHNGLTTHTGLPGYHTTDG